MQYHVFLYIVLFIVTVVYYIQYMAYPGHPYFGLWKQFLDFMHTSVSVLIAEVINSEVIRVYIPVLSIRTKGP